VELRVELRGLEPLTPTLPAPSLGVCTRPVKCIAAGQTSETDGGGLARTALDDDQLCPEVGHADDASEWPRRSARSVGKQGERLDVVGAHDPEVPLVEGRDLLYV
jgi:hypothetical protein